MSHKIEWCDKTINPLIIPGNLYASPNGWHCTKITSGCKYCYAERINILRGNKIPYDDQDVEYKINLKCFEKLPKKPCRVFLQSMSDIFHRCVTLRQIYRIFFEMAMRPQHTWIIATKRPERALEFFNWVNYNPESNPNLHMLFSASTQDDLEDGANSFLKIPVKVHGLSLEPLLEPIIVGDGIDWVIVGPETGAHRRECEIEWIEDIVNQCKRDSVPCFVKALPLDGKINRNPDEWPVHLRVRQFPEMSKLLEINSCKECSWVDRWECDTGEYHYVEYRPYCLLAQLTNRNDSIRKRRITTSLDTIPEWCPLLEAK